jgi:hypothetical protein
MDTNRRASSVSSFISPLPVLRLPKCNISVAVVQGKRTG